MQTGIGRILSQTAPRFLCLEVSARVPWSRSVLTCALRCVSSTVRSAFPSGNCIQRAVVHSKLWAQAEFHHFQSHISQNSRAGMELCDCYDNLLYDSVSEFIMEQNNELGLTSTRRIHMNKRYSMCCSFLFSL